MMARVDLDFEDERPREYLAAARAEPVRESLTSEGHEPKARNLVADIIARVAVSGHQSVFGGNMLPQS